MGSSFFDIPLRVKLIEPGHSTKERPEISPESLSVWPSKVFQPFLDSLERFERPIILDLGATSGDNISFFGGRGAKVYAYDLLRELQESSSFPLQEESEVEEFGFESWKRTLDGLEFALYSLHGILFWDILDKLPQAWARELIGRVAVVLEQGGLMLSFFGDEKRRENRTLARFRIKGPDRIEHLSNTTPHPIQQFYQNSEIMHIFPASPF
jgi:SAM-dependent methyltransferase